MILMTSMNYRGQINSDPWSLFRGMMLRIGLAYIAAALFGIWFSTVRHSFHADTFLIIVVSQSVVATRNVWGTDVRGIKWAVCGGLTLLALAFELALIPAGLPLADILFDTTMIAIMITAMIWILTGTFSIKRRQLAQGKILRWPWKHAS